MQSSFVQLPQTERFNEYIYHAPLNGKLCKWFDVSMLLRQICNLNHNTISTKTILDGTFVKMKQMMSRNTRWHHYYKNVIQG